MSPEDEADVFLEKRSVNDLSRNGLVAAFLRRLEYYEGILFLTTNRVEIFDEAFQSRIHISLRYNELSSDAKRQIWTAFLKKAGMDLTSVTELEWTSLAKAKVNGRQIKNSVKSSQGLAASRGQAISYTHIREVLTIMEQFEKRNDGKYFSLIEMLKFLFLWCYELFLVNVVARIHKVYT